METPTSPIEGVSPETIQKIISAITTADQTQLEEIDLKEVGLVTGWIRERARWVLNRAREKEIAQRELTTEEAMAILKQQYNAQGFLHRTPSWEEVEARITPEQLELVRGLMAPVIFKMGPMERKIYVTDGIRNIPEHLAGNYQASRQQTLEAGYRLMRLKEYSFGFNKEGKYDSETGVGTWLESGENLDKTRKLDDWLTCESGKAAIGMVFNKGDRGFPMPGKPEWANGARRVVEISIADEAQVTPGIIARTIKAIKSIRLAA